MDLGTRIVDPIEFMGFTFKGLWVGYGKIRYQRVTDPECAIIIHKDAPRGHYRVSMRFHENVLPPGEDSPVALMLHYSATGSLLACERAIRHQRGKAFPWEIEV